MPIQLGSSLAGQRKLLTCIPLGTDLDAHLRIVRAPIFFVYLSKLGDVRPWVGPRSEHFLSS